LAPGKLNVAGENHTAARPRRDGEKVYAQQVGGKYWQEKGFSVDIADKSVKDQVIKGKSVKGDPNDLILGFRLTNVEQFLTNLGSSPTRKRAVSAIAKLGMVDRSIARDEHLGIALAARPELMKASARLNKKLVEIRDSWDPDGSPLGADKLEEVLSKVRFAEIYLRDLTSSYSAATGSGKEGRDVDQDYESSRMERSIAMFLAAAAYNGEGLWKIGNNHVIDIKKFIVELKTGAKKGTYKKELANFESRVRLMTKGEFVEGYNQRADPP
jgi:hypothetical protein